MTRDNQSRTDGRNTAVADKSNKVAVGDEWAGSIAHRWRVVEIKPFGRAEIRSVNEDGSLGFKFGEMRLCDIRNIADRVPA